MAEAHGRRPELTAVDRKILTILRRDARTPNNAIAAEVGVAPSTSLTRIRAMERSGIIRGYHADVDPDAWGAPLQVLISVRLRAGARHRLRDFTEAMRGRPEVLNIYFLGGHEDFLLHVAVPDSTAMRDFVLDQLSSHSEVAATQTSIIFDHVRCDSS